MATSFVDLDIETQLRIAKSKKEVESILNNKLHKIKIANLKDYGDSTVPLWIFYNQDKSDLSVIVIKSKDVLVFEGAVSRNGIDNDVKDVLVGEYIMYTIRVNFSYEIESVIDAYYKRFLVV